MGGAREANQLIIQAGGEGPAPQARRLGLSIPTAGISLAEVPALAARAEELGWTDAWSFEVNWFDAFTPLAAVGAVTQRMRLGTAIVPAFFRPAGLLAMQAAALADLAPGRVVVGIGSSTPVVVEQWMGIPFQRPRTRVLETVRGVRSLLAGERVGGMKLMQPPAQPVAIWMAALGGRMLESAAEEADGICLFMTGPRFIRSLLADAARPLDSMCRINVLPGRGEAVIAAARRAVTAYAIVPFYARAMERQGFAEEVAAVNRSWAAGDRAGASAQVSDAMVAELVLTGDADDIAEGIERYREAGLGCPVLAVTAADGASAAALEELLPLLPARA